MKVVQLDTANFRGIKAATMHFDGHALFVGFHNVCRRFK
jgi:hypothetical protein